MLHAASCWLLLLIDWWCTVPQISNTCRLYVVCKIYTFPFLWTLTTYETYFFIEGFFTFHASLSIISEGQTSFLSCSVSSDWLVLHTQSLQWARMQVCIKMLHIKVTCLWGKYFLYNVFCVMDPESLKVVWLVYTKIKSNQWFLLQVLQNQMS